MKQLTALLALLLALLGFSTEFSDHKRPQPAQRQLPPTWTAAPTFTPRPTRTLAATSTALPTHTPTPILTLTPIKTPFTNAEWTPVEQAFDGVTMVLVPAKCFMMGSLQAQVDAQVDAGFFWTTDQLPQHEQCFEQPFWIDKYEVTQADFARQDGQKATANYFSGDQLPVDQITWFEARDFCALRGGRLPSEREWEFAARGPDGLLYPWGNEWNGDNLVWDGFLSGQSAPVGSHPAGVSWVGALDMSGNIMEWVSTTYGVFDADRNEVTSAFEYPYLPDDGRETLDDDVDKLHVLRGSSWFYTYPEFFRTSYREKDIASGGNNHIGFRCARDFE